MNLTPYHAKYIAHELTRRCASDFREIRRTSALAQSLQDKLSHQKEIRELERRRTNKRRELFDAQDAIDAKREDLIGKVEEKLKQSSSVEQLFTIRWRVT